MINSFHNEAIFRPLIKHFSERARATHVRRSILLSGKTGPIWGDFSHNGENYHSQPLNDRRTRFFHSILLRVFYFYFISALIFVRIESAGFSLGSIVLIRRGHVRK